MNGLMGTQIVKGGETGGNPHVKSAEGHEAPRKCLLFAKPGTTPTNGRDNLKRPSRPYFSVRKAVER